MTVVPTVLAFAGWVLSVRRLLPAAGARASTERVAATARALLDGVDTLHLTVRERTLLRDHLNEVSASVSLARRAETFLRYYTAGFALVILLLGAGVLYAAVNLAGHLSYDLVRWCFDHGVMPLYTPIGGSWLNMAESVQRIIVRRALSGQHPKTAQQVIEWLEQTVAGWNADPTPFVWNGKRRLRRLAGSGAAMRVCKPIVS